MPPDQGDRRWVVGQNTRWTGWPRKQWLTLLPHRLLSSDILWISIFQVLTQHSTLSAMWQKTGGFERPAGVNPLYLDPRLSKKKIVSYLPIQQLMLDAVFLSRINNTIFVHRLWSSVSAEYTFPQASEKQEYPVRHWIREQIAMTNWMDTTAAEWRIWPWDKWVNMYRDRAWD